MPEDKITVLVSARVMGPMGAKLQPGTVVELDDGPYTRILIKSGDVLLIDPPSLDPEFLEKLRSDVTGQSEQVGVGVVSDRPSDATSSKDQDPGGAAEDGGASSEGHGGPEAVALDADKNRGRKASSSNRIKRP